MPYFENKYEGGILVRRIYFTILLFSSSVIYSFGQDSFCNGFTAGFQSKARSEGQSLVTPVCPVPDAYCTESEFQCGYMKGVETAIEKIAVIKSESRAPVYRYNSPQSSSDGVFQVPSFGRIAYEIEAAKSPEQRRREAEARERLRQQQAEERAKNKKINDAIKASDMKRYLFHLRSGLRDLSVTRHFDNKYDYRTSYETYYNLSEKNYVVSRLSYFRTSSSPLLSLGYGRTITPFEKYGLFETSIDAAITARQLNGVFTPVQEVRLSMYTSSFRNSFGLNWQISTNQQIRQGEFNASISSFMGFCYKRRFIIW